jgi:hypothetical protein
MKLLNEILVMLHVFMIVIIAAVVMQTEFFFTEIYASLSSYSAIVAFIGLLISVYYKNRKVFITQFIFLLLFVLCYFVFINFDEWILGVEYIPADEYIPKDDLNGKIE